MQHRDIESKAEVLDFTVIFTFTVSTGCWAKVAIKRLLSAQEITFLLRINKEWL